MTWVKWLWRNERWDGCGVPWDHNVVKRPMCNTKQVTTVHKQLMDAVMGGVLHAVRAPCTKSVQDHAPPA